MEHWCDIPDYPNYQVSNFGNVRNKKRGNILKPKSVHKKYGYICYEVNITHTDGKQKHGKIHRLVAKAFIPNPDNKPEVDHIDRDPSNNRADNLRWVSRSENMINVSIRSDNVSGHRGIHFSNQNQKWRITYQFEKKAYHGGYYNTFEEAVANYKDPSELKSGEIPHITLPSKNKLGHKYITMNKNRYVFEINRNEIRHRKSFPTLEEAIAYKEEYLKTNL